MILRITNACNIKNILFIKWLNGCDLISSGSFRFEDENFNLQYQMYYGQVNKNKKKSCYAVIK